VNKQFRFIIGVVFLVMLAGFSFFYFLESDKPPKDNVLSAQKMITNPDLKKVKKTVSQKEDEVLEKKSDDVIEVEPMMFEVVEPVKEIFVTRNEEKDQKIKSMLQVELEKFYDYCQITFTSKSSKRSIKEKLSQFQCDSREVDSFLVDYNGNTLVGKNDHEDIDSRTIVLEQIQQVRKNGEGFIVSRIDHNGLKRYIFVKNLDIQELYIGVDILKRDEK